jgi:ketosteroid isomerase-like protein
MQQFRDAIESRNLDGVVALLTDDVVFRSPVVRALYQGRGRVKALLRAVGQVLEDFH